MRENYGLEFLRDEKSTTEDEVLYSLERAAEKVNNVVKESYKEYLREKFGVVEGKENLGAEVKDPEPGLDYNLPEGLGFAIAYHKRLHQIANQRDLDVTESRLNFGDEYNPKNMGYLKREATDEFVGEMPTEFTTNIDME